MITIPASQGAKSLHDRLSRLPLENLFADQNLDVHEIQAISGTCSFARNFWKEAAVPSHLRDLCVY